MFRRLKDGVNVETEFPSLSMIWRRYSEFEQLQQYLQTEYSYIVVPPVPEKKNTYTWRNSNTVIQDVTDPDFVDRRRAGLEVRFVDFERARVFLFLPLPFYRCIPRIVAEFSTSSSSASDFM